MAAEINRIEEQMVRIPGGHIRLSDERTKHRWNVKITSFLLAAYPVTQQLYFAVTQKAPFAFPDDQNPAESVSWNNAIHFCNQLSRKEGLESCYTIHDLEGAVSFNETALGYRLPTEAEWEFACRAGNSEVRYGPLDTIAWYHNNAQGHTHPVGRKKPNAWGLHDMLGNIWEWCWDVYDEKVYGAYRVFRGGGWNDNENSCRASCRRKSHPTFQIDDLGFRIARSIG